MLSENNDTFSQVSIQSTHSLPSLKLKTLKWNPLKKYLDNKGQKNQTLEPEKCKFTISANNGDLSDCNIYNSLRNITEPFIDKKRESYTSKFNRRLKSPKSFKSQIYNFLDRPSGWKCFIYHFTV